MALEKISLEKAKEIAEEKGLKPGKVKGAGGIQFTKGDNENIEVIDWDEFEEVMNKENLAVFESNGWMKLQRDD